MANTNILQAGADNYYVDTRLYNPGCVHKAAEEKAATIYRYNKIRSMEMITVTKRYRAYPLAKEKLYRTIELGFRDGDWYIHIHDPGQGTYTMTLDSWAEMVKFLFRFRDWFSRKQILNISSRLYNKVKKQGGLKQNAQGI